jgi:gamma-glutamyl phosphate reductase
MRQFRISPHAIIRGMVKAKQSAKAILEALKVEMAQPHITASALGALYRCDVEQQKLVLVDEYMHRWK